MATAAPDQPTTVQKRKSPAARIAGLLGSVPFASTVVALIAVACIVGTLLPQGAQVPKYLAAHPGRKGLISVLETLGLTHVFSSVWFIALLVLLAFSLGVCSFRRFKVARRLTGRPRGAHSVL